jgi:hypothetical protein
MMLALERKVTVLDDGSVSVRSQPFGGGVRILNEAHLQAIIGEVQFDRERSEHEADFRSKCRKPTGLPTLAASTLRCQ